ncbi:MAG: diacylglycerol kinase family protein [Oscillospiraceae bacterium]|nr:diacylglycerol kinase family protein [Oscillospiraceae bacterium]
MKRFLKGFVYAARGIALCVYERNFRFHICAASFVLFFAGCFYELSRAEWAALFIVIGMVLSMEALNTALEHLSDRVTKENDELIRRCKDCAAGAVLVSAAAAVAGGISVLWDAERISAIWDFYCTDVWRAVALLAAVAGAVMFVLLPERFKKK